MNAFSTIVIRASLFLAVFSLFFMGSSGVAQAASVCFCTVGSTLDLDAATAKTFDLKNFEDASQFDRQCLPEVSQAVDCQAKSTKVDAKFTECKLQESPEVCRVKQQEFDKNIEVMKQIVIQAANGVLPAGNVGGAAPHQQGLLAKVLPDCVFDTTVQGECKDVNIFIKLAIDVANVLISIIGGVALIAFLYGGFILILSEGNSEKIDKGKDAMVAALIGLAVVFGAYLLVNILSDALNVSSTFRLQ